MRESADLPPLNAVERLLASKRKSDEAIRGKEGASNKNRDAAADRQQVKDIENYKLAVQRMMRDVAVLQDQIIFLGDENSAMRSQLQQQQNAATLAADVVQLQSASKEDLLFRYGTLRQELLAKTTELTRYKEKLSRLSQQLTSRGGVVGLELTSTLASGASLPDQLQNAVTVLQRKYSNMRRAYEQQVEVNRGLHQRAEKADRLQRACRLQEKVIERLELVLQQTQQPAEQQVQEPAQPRSQQPSRQAQQGVQPSPEPQQPSPVPQQPQRHTTPNQLPLETPQPVSIPAPAQEETAVDHGTSGNRAPSSRSSAAKMLEGIKELKEQVAALTSAVRLSATEAAAAVPKEGEPDDEAKHLKLLVELEAAEGRIRSLESQVQDSARLWGREKEELLLKLQETANPRV